MFNHTTRLSIILLLAILIGNFAPINAVQAETSDAPPRQSPQHLTLEPISGNTAIYTLDQITGAGELVLRGSGASYTVYASIPKEWKLTGTVLRLTVTHSPVLRPDSTLTVNVNGTPVSGLGLSPENVDATAWDVTVPPELLTGKVLAVWFSSAYLRVSDDVCADILNDANWVGIASTSTFEYTFDRQPFTPELSEFPYPFIRTRALEPDAAVMVLPSGATGTELIPAFYLSSAMGAQATYRGISLYALMPGDSP